MMEITSAHELLDIKREIGMLGKEISLIGKKDFLHAKFKEVEYLEFISRNINDSGAILKVKFIKF